MKGLNKKGISLIVLVITIIVMIILAAAIILALNSSNLTSKANWAKVSSDRASLQAEYVSVLAKAMSDKVDGKASMVTVTELKETPEYKAWAQKVTDAGFTVEEPEDDNDPAAIRVVAKLSEDQLTAYGLEYYEDKTEVKGYDWVVNKDVKVIVKVDGVIIPEGFVASIYDGEKTKAEGLVIYETDSLAGVDQETAMKSFNQFVWVPVENFSKFVRSTTYTGKLTELSNEGRYREPIQEVDIMKDGRFETIILSLENDLTGEWTEYGAMRESVQAYQGFYIGRYETGTNVDRYSANIGTTDVLIQKDKPVYHCVGWGTSMIDVTGDLTGSGTNRGIGAVALSRDMYKTSEDIVSTLCYGVQWDSTLQFIATNTEHVNYPLKSGDKGNFASEVANTGSNDDYAVNNIYDMAGNVEEWTMEASYDGSRILRGGGVANTSRPASYRQTYSPEHSNAYYGFRIALYLRVPAES